VENAPKLLVPGEPWIIIMDGLVVNGQKLTRHGLTDRLAPSKIPLQFKGKLVAMLDTGTSVITAPPYYVDAIYKDVPGVQPIADAPPGFWFVPCDTKFNVSVVFAGVEYPIHPIDLLRVDTSLDNTTVVCVNTMLYNSPRAADGQDFLLGDAFLRNVYALFNFGNFTNSSAGPPYIQLLSMTDPAKAAQEFDTLQAQKIQQWYDLMIFPNNSTGSSNSSGALSNKIDNSKAHLLNDFVIVGLLAAVILILAAIAVMQILGHGKSEGGMGKYKEIHSTSERSYEREGAYSD